MRSKYKICSLSPSLFNIIFNSTCTYKKYSRKIYIKDRYSTINSFISNLNLYIYNGLKYYKLNINKHMFGYKLGEFSITKKKCVYKSKKKAARRSKNRNKKKNQSSKKKKK